jgi:single-strand DNA-binding protein
MASLNKVILLGNLTRDPELRYTPNGTPVSTFGLAVNRRYRQGDEWKDEVCYIDIVTYGRQAETVGEYLNKGSMAMIEGRLQWRSWETEDGQKRSKHEVVASNVQFLPRLREEGGGRTPTDFSSTSTAEDFPLPGDDDIPFVRLDISDLRFDERFRPDMMA